RGRHPQCSIVQRDVAPIAEAAAGAGEHGIHRAAALQWLGPHLYHCTASDYGAAAPGARVSAKAPRTASDRDWCDIGAFDASIQRDQARAWASHEVQPTLKKEGKIDHELAGPVLSDPRCGK